VQSHATVNKNGGSLKLLNVTKRIEALLSITKLLTVFETYDSEAEAVTSFSAGFGTA
jgi:anti-sigma B factor antagonist